MSSRLLTTVLCDACLITPRPREREADEITVTVGRRNTKKLALCEPHRKKILDPLLEVLDTIKGEQTKL